MARYKLAKTAEKDFENILDFGIDTFGLTQALNYQLGMKKRFEELAEDPKRYVAVDYIRTGYYRSVYRSHSIFYKIELNYVLIVRILGQQEPRNALSSRFSHLD